jgi:hypothetical protein
LRHRDRFGWHLMSQPRALLYDGRGATFLRRIYTKLPTP